MKKTQLTSNQSGNVLFLILIAVALFAALSYAVTQSTRSGGGSADRETSLLNSAALTQYPASLRTSLIRMILNGVAPLDLEFNRPDDFAALTVNNGLRTQGVFHPEGGGAVYQNAPNEVLAGGTGEYFYNAEFFIPQIGVDTAVTGNDIIAFLPGISAAVCESINERIGIVTDDCVLQAGTTVPTLLTASSTADEIDTVYMDESAYPTAFPTPIALQGNDSGGTCNAFSGQPTGCFFEASNTRYVFYSTLLER